MKRSAARRVLLAETCAESCCNVMVVSEGDRLHISGFCSPGCCGACGDFIEQLLGDPAYGIVSVGAA